MATQNSFDIVSKVDMQEVRNAVQNAMKEVQTRFDFKGSHSDIEVGEDYLQLKSNEEFLLKSLVQLLEEKLVKRKVSLKALTYGAVEKALGSTVRQRISLQQGIPTEKSREIVKLIKNSKLKVQAAIQADTVRVSGRDRDELQKVIQLLREKDMGIHMEFTNYRTN